MHKQGIFSVQGYDLSQNTYGVKGTQYGVQGPRGAYKPDIPILLRTALLYTGIALFSSRVHRKIPSKALRVLYFLSLQSKAKRVF